MSNSKRKNPFNDYDQCYWDCKYKDYEEDVDWDWHYCKHPKMKDYKRSQGHKDILEREQCPHAPYIDGYEAFCPYYERKHSRKNSNAIWKDLKQVKIGAS